MNDSSKVSYSLSKCHLIHKILDPNCEFLSLWNRVFHAVCLFALFIDPLSFLVLYVPVPSCFDRNQGLLMTFTIVRSLGDMFYCINIILKFRTAFILPGSTVFGEGELVMEPEAIARQYLRSEFITDFSAAFPLPQIMNWIIIPNVNKIAVAPPGDTLALVVLVQYVPRFYIIFPLSWRIMKNNGFVTKTSTAGAAYNLLLYMLASHVIGSTWHLLSIQSLIECWALECEKDGLGSSPCQASYLDCKSPHTDAENIRREFWLKVTPMFDNCAAKNRENRLKYGPLAEALTGTVRSVKFFDRYLYCLWWGLKNLSSYGQNLEARGYFTETAFCAFICGVGLLLFCLLIANVQMYLQSKVTRFDKWREKARETKKWMRKRELPLDLQERIHKFWHFKWFVTRGIDETEIIRSLPQDFRHGVQRHLCLHLVHRVHFFSKMDNQLLDAICDRLVCSLNIADTYVVHEGDPVDEMLFIVRGKLKSSTTDGGRSGFFNSVVVESGDYCGEELLTWALMTNETNVLPSSTRTLRAVTDVEAFALRADDLNYVANQFKRLHSKEILHIFRFYSHQWRTWGACCIQAAWRRFKKKRLLQELRRFESLGSNPAQDNSFEGECEDSGLESTNERAAADSASFVIQAAWRRYRNRNRELQQLLEMCETFYYLPH